MAELTINTGDITAAIRKNLDGFTADTSLTQVGLELGSDGLIQLRPIADHTDLVVEEKAAIVKIGRADHGHIVIDHQGL